MSRGDDGYDPFAPGSRRYPRVIDQAEIDSLPVLKYSSGIESAIFISRERDDARYFRQGVCTIEPDAEPYEWFASTFDESQYCTEGVIRVEASDADGRLVILEAGPGEHLFLPAGYQYRWVPTGRRTTMLWTSGPSAPVGLSAREYGAQLVASRGTGGGAE
ncbi:conserved hypothetical protein [Frankia canadensis]|uniref:Uncharacterized protein n=1 Tax=Frankia canadensis TaxID=1836972 RepID=A0A2I2KVR7_9ACTN|nr:hypothetical protein [Frankia canadensis]SNQ49759.1 conserved hypothetical protein [Frankia canadensis]SOU57049.1 conserved hypothetical protein [Frankia canadensis]